VVGKEYGTRPWELVDRTAEVPVVESDLAKLPALFRILPGANPMEEWARPELIRRLVRWWDVIKYYCDVDAPIPVVSAYRRLGTSVPVGKPEPDWCGARDSNDRFGHWRGLAVDLQTKDWRKYNCGEKELPLAQLDAMAKEARLFRPWKTNDPTHWTVIERAEGGSLPWP
jgi:hypothetical protein